MRLVSGLSGQTACSTPPWVSMQYNVRTTSAAWILHASGQQRQHVSAPARPACERPNPRIQSKDFATGVN